MRLKSSIFIPKTINVGYQNRSDTYTGKLAYVIYYDEKGKLRKEASWNSWRDEKIPNEEFENVPMSGFVLNKKVGDYGGWEHRQAYCRVYDPRNFEFEITIENLLYILENANSIKGKGLEGEFVYGWDGKDLILMPVESPDYKQIAEYNNIVHNNEHIKAKDLIVGATYLTKDNTELVYVGKFEYYSHGYEWRENGEVKRSKSWKDVPKDGQHYYSTRISYDYIQDLPYGKHFWFAYKSYDYDYVNGNRVNKATYKWAFEQFKSIPKGKLIKCIDEKSSPEYANIFESMEGCYTYCPYDCNKDKFFDVSLEDFVGKSKRYSSRDELYYGDFEFISSVSGGMQIFKAYNTNNKENKYILKRKVESSRGKGYYDYVDDTSIFPTEIVEVEKSVYKGWHTEKEIVKEKKMIPVTIEEMFDVMKPLYRQKYLENGREYERVWSLR